MKYLRKFEREEDPTNEMVGYPSKGKRKPGELGNIKFEIEQLRMSLDALKPHTNDPAIPALKKALDKFEKDYPPAFR